MSIVLIVMSIIFGIALLGLILAHPQRKQKKQPKSKIFSTFCFSFDHLAHNYLATNYGVRMPAKLLHAPQHGVFLEKQPVASTKLVELEFPKNDAVEFHGVYREQAAAVVAAPQKELLQKRQTIKSLSHNDAPVSNKASKNVPYDEGELEPEVEEECQLSTFGIFIIAVAGLLGIFLFALKVKSIW